MRLQSKYVDQFGYEYKSKRSKSSKVKSFIDPSRATASVPTVVATDAGFSYRTANHSITYSHKTSVLRVALLVPPIFDKRFRDGKATDVESSIVPSVDLAEFTLFAKLYTDAA